MDPLTHTFLAPIAPTPRVVDLIDAPAAPAVPAAPAGQITAIEPRVPIAIRPGTLADVAFIDRLQKAQSREVGFLPTMAIEGKIKLGQVLIAEAGGTGDRGLGTGEDKDTAPLPLPPVPSPQSPVPLGYVIAADRYCRRDEIGYVTQINVLPEYRRHLVAAALLAAQFDRSAYGCRLYGCWCAQDLKANEFWEAMGFTAIAFRTGSRTKGRDANGRPMPRIHLFWQKRIRASDTTTPWWYPAKTEGGEMREDRLVFPIPPGMHWRDVLPIVLPEGVVADRALEDTAANPDPLPAEKKKKKPKASTKPAGPVAGLWFGGAAQPTADDLAARAEARAIAKAAAKEAAAKVDPRLVALSRELRDRWSETAEYLLSMPGKYDLRRELALTASDVRPAASFAPMSMTSPAQLPYAA